MNMKSHSRDLKKRADIAGQIVTRIIGCLGHQKTLKSSGQDALTCVSHTTNTYINNKLNNLTRWKAKKLQGMKTHKRK